MIMKCCLSCSDESCDFVYHILVHCKLGICDNKVDTSFVVTFSLPKGEKNVMTSQNVKVAEASGTLPAGDAQEI